MGKAITPSQGSKRKQYDLPGQIHDPPEESEPLRIFYESLFSQRPDSEMAQIWMMEHGLLDEEDAVRVQKVKAHSRSRDFGTNSNSSQRTPPLTGRASPAPRSRSGGKGAKAADDLVPLGRPKAPEAKKPVKKTPQKPTYENNESDDEKPLARAKGPQAKKPAMRASQKPASEDDDSDDDKPLGRAKAPEAKRLARRTTQKPASEDDESDDEKPLTKLKR